MPHALASPALIFLCLLALAAKAATPTTTDDKALAGMLNQLLPTWTWTTGASASLGYRDNVLMGPSHPEGSAFFRGEIDGMLAKVPEGKWDGFAYLNAEELRYTSARTADFERSVILATQARWMPNSAWRATLAGRGYHQVQVFDVSVTEAELSSALLQVTGFSLTPTLRCSVLPVWFEVAGQTRQDRYKDQVDGYEEKQFDARIGRDWGRASEISFGASRMNRDHDSREQFTLGGRPISGSRLSVEQVEYYARFVLASSKPGWRVVASASRQEYRDNGTGFFDYNREMARLEASWKYGKIELRGVGGISRYVFPQQAIGFGTDPEVRKKQEYHGRFEANYAVNETWTTLLVYEHEEARSNDERSRFRVNTAYAGIRWSWDNFSRLSLE